MSKQTISEKQRDMLMAGLKITQCVADPSEQMRLSRLANRGLVKRLRFQSDGHLYRTTPKGRALLRGRHN